jgi:hypothetical protein
MDPAAFSLKWDNTYEIADAVSRMVYVFDDGEKTYRIERELMMERIDREKSIGRSVYEFYNLFSIDRDWRGKRVTVTITAADRSGEYPLARQTIILEVT